SSPQLITKPDTIPPQPPNALTNSDSYIVDPPHFQNTTQQCQYERVFEDVYEYDSVVEDLLVGRNRNHTQNEPVKNEALVNESVENEALMNKPTENKDPMKEPTENEDN
ncbi:hypothetical protein PanWU01x14_004900, partial [Parasponia andersonii]